MSVHDERLRPPTWAQGSWVVHAACRDHPQPDLWFPDTDPVARAEAQRICRSCPVQLECDTHATRIGATSGIWAGLQRDKYGPPSTSDVLRRQQLDYERAQRARRR